MTLSRAVILSDFRHERSRRISFRFVHRQSEIPSPSGSTRAVHSLRMTQTQAPSCAVILSERSARKESKNLIPICTKTERDPSARPYGLTDSRRLSVLRMTLSRAVILSDFRHERSRRISFRFVYRQSEIPSPSGSTRAVHSLRMTVIEVLRQNLIL